MRTNPIARLWILAILPVLTAPLFSQNADRERYFRVLVLHPTMQTSVWFNNFDTGLYGTLTERSSTQIVVYTRYLGIDMIPLEQSEEAILDELRKSAELIQPDVVVSVFPAMHAFLVKYKAELFPGIPTIFVPTLDSQFDAIDSLPDTYIIKSASHYAMRKTLENIITLIPDLRRLVVCVGVSGNDLPYLLYFQELIKTLGPRFEIEYLPGIPFDDLLQRTATLEPGSAILLLPISRDNKRVFYNTEDLFPRLPREAAAPVFGFSDSTFGLGMVGGNMSSARAYGEYTAELALAIRENGNFHIDDYRVISKEMYDWRELERWNIREDLLPPGSEIYFREESFFRKYTVQIVSAIGIMIFLSISVAALYLLLLKQKRTEALLRENEQKLRSSLEEKDLLLREVHHRVKNNMAIISSFLDLQEMNVKDDAVHSLIRSSQDRIRSMALIHEQLYKDESLANIDVSEYIEELVHSLVASYSNQSADVEIDLEIESVRMGIDTLIPVGLIVNEIVSNSMKYAFRNTEKPKLSIRMTRNAERGYLLEIDDNGCGLPDSVTIEDGGSIGFLLINTLIEQLNGTLEIRRNGGTGFRITF